MTDPWQPGQLLFVGFTGTRLPPYLRTWLERGRVGGVVLFSRNIQDPPALRSLVRGIHVSSPEDVPALVAVDQEGGRVQRLRRPFTEFPPMARVAAGGGPDAAAAVGRALAVECREAGIGWNFAPVADVHTQPSNPVIGDRSFGGRAEEVAACVAAQVRAMQEEGVAACAKHFPGHGDTTVDSHHDLPVVPHGLDRLRAVELPPFAAAVRAQAASVMTAHVLVPKVDPRRPATFSPDVLALLRHQLGYDGVVVTDDLEMGAVAGRIAPETMAAQALAAGVDVLLSCRDRALQEVLLRSLERLPDAVLEAPLRRVARLKERFAGPARMALAGGDPPRGPPYPEHRALAARLGGPAVGTDPTEGGSRR